MTRPNIPHAMLIEADLDGRHQFVDVARNELAVTTSLGESNLRLFTAYPFHAQDVAPILFRGPFGATDRQSIQTASQLAAFTGAVVHAPNITPLHRTMRDPSVDLATIYRGLNTALDSKPLKVDEVDEFALSLGTGHMLERTLTDGRRGHQTVIAGMGMTAAKALSPETRAAIDQETTFADKIKVGLEAPDAKKAQRRLGARFFASGTFVDGPLMLAKGEFGTFADSARGILTEAIGNTRPVPGSMFRQWVLTRAIAAGSIMDLDPLLGDLNYKTFGVVGEKDFVFRPSDIPQSDYDGFTVVPGVFHPWATSKSGHKLMRAAAELYVANRQD